MIGKALFMLLLVVLPETVFDGLVKQNEKLPVKTLDLRVLLLKLNDRKADDEILADLFAVGEGRTAELIRLLDDQSEEVSLRAQIIIRYLGNDFAMKQLHQWLDRQNQVAVAGPIPVPLRERDYRVIQLNFIEKNPNKWPNAERYILALAIDGSSKAKEKLNILAKLAGNTSYLTYTGRSLALVRNLPPQGREVRLVSGEDLAKAVLNNAFFVSAEDRKYTSAKLIGFNQKRDKAIIEICINRGPLSEEWYHVVVRISGQSWSYLSISQIAVS